jgi:hypothetical protein
MSVTIDVSATRKIHPNVVERATEVMIPIGPLQSAFFVSSICIYM